MNLKSKLRLCMLVIIAIMNLNAQTFAQNINHCLSIEEVDISLLPSNMRIIIDNNENGLLQLYNPFNNLTVILQNTNFGFGNNSSSALPLLYQDDERVFLHKGNSWQSMNIDGSDTSIDKDVPDPRYIVFNNSGQLLFLDWDIDIAWADRQYQILNVTTGDITDFVFPDLVDFVESTIADDPTPQRWAINPAFDYQAYDAWDDVSESGQFNIVARIQKIPEGDYFDVSSDMIGDLPLGIISWKSDYILGILRYREDIEFVFDVLSQEQVMQISSPDDEWDIVMPSVLAPNQMIYAALYGTNKHDIPYVIELTDSQGNHVRCLQIEEKPEAIRLTNNYGIGGSIHWTHDSRFLWWLECDSEKNALGRCEGTYRLALFDLDTDQYGVLLPHIGINSRVGFVDK